MSATARSEHAVLQAQRVAHKDRVSAYAKMLSLFTGGLIASRVLAYRYGYPLLDRVDPKDFIVLSLATHRVSMTVTQDRVTEPLREPFMEERVKPGTSDELERRLAGRGIIRSFGELMTCKYCLAPWVAAAFYHGMVYAPRTTRTLGAIFATSAVADFLHLHYSRMQKSLA